MNYKEIYKHDMLKYIDEETYNIYGPRTHFYKFNGYIIAFGKFKETNKIEVDIIKTNKNKLNLHKICNYIIVLIQEKFLERGSRYVEDVYFRCSDFYTRQEIYYLMSDIVPKMNSLGLYKNQYFHIDEDANLLLSSKDKLLTRAEHRVIGSYFYLPHQIY